MPLERSKIRCLSLSVALFLVLGLSGLAQTAEPPESLLEVVLNQPLPRQ